MACCKSKQGLRLDSEEHDLVDAAFEENQTRYGAMHGDIFNATVPFGSLVRMPTQEWRTWSKIAAVPVKTAKRKKGR